MPSTTTIRRQVQGTFPNHTYVNVAVSSPGLTDRQKIWAEKIPRNGDDLSQTAKIKSTIISGRECFHPAKVGDYYFTNAHLLKKCNPSFCRSNNLHVTTTPKINKIAGIAFAGIGVIQHPVVTGLPKIFIGDLHDFHGILYGVICGLTSSVCIHPQ
jgi:hypothetical protein